MGSFAKVAVRKSKFTAPEVLLTRCFTSRYQGRCRFSCSSWELESPPGRNWEISAAFCNAGPISQGNFMGFSSPCQIFQHLSGSHSWAVLVRIVLHFRENIWTIRSSWQTVVEYSQDERLCSPVMHCPRQQGVSKMGYNAKTQWEDTHNSLVKADLFGLR